MLESAKIWLLIFLSFHGLGTLNTFGITNKQSNANNSPPVIIIPGDAGSVLEARLNKPVSAGDECPTKRDWFRLWLNVLDMTPSKLKCGVDNRKLIFDPITNISSNTPGVETRTPGFGTAYAVEYIDDSWAAYFLGKAGSYAHNLVDELLGNGYKRDVSVRGAPYDFRIAMNSQQDLFARLRQLIESTYSLNKNAKVALISHSLGGIFTTWFLNHQSQHWKNCYIDSFISLSTPWGGTMDTMQAVTSGYTFGLPLVNPLVVRKEQRSIETNYLLLPDVRVSPDVIIMTDERNYSASREDLNEMFQRIGISTQLYNYVRDANDVTKIGVMPQHPGVLTYCLYGTGVDTTNVLDYRGKSFPNENPKIATIPGDGTVSYQSLSACSEWNLGEREITFPSVNHSGVLKEKQGIKAIMAILQRKK